MAVTCQSYLDIPVCPNHVFSFAICFQSVSPRPCSCIAKNAVCKLREMLLTEENEYSYHNEWNTFEWTCGCHLSMSFLSWHPSLTTSCFPSVLHNLLFISVSYLIPDLTIAWLTFKSESDYLIGFPNILLNLASKLIIKTANISLYSLHALIL